MADDGDLEDWETEWEDSLAQLKISDLPKSQVAVAGPQGGVRPRDRQEPAAAQDTLPSPASDHHVSKGRIYEHVVELYDFPRSTTQSDLEAFMECFHTPGSEGLPVLKMVDDCHALGIFLTPSQAREALSAKPSAALRVRPFAQASAAAKQVPDSELQPPKARPKTTSAVARRLLGSALGMNLRDKAADKDLAEQRKAKKEGEKAKKAALEAVWNDDSD